MIAGCYEAAQTKQAVIPVIDVGGKRCVILPRAGSETVPRNDYKLVQTPQVFEAQLLKEAYQQEYTDAFTDDVLVVEAMGREVCLVQGNRENIKLTTPFDLKIAEVLILNASISLRVT